MKKTISLSLIFSFVLALAIQMPVFATDTTATSTVQTAPTNYPTLTANSSSTPVYNQTVNFPENTATSTTDKPMLISYPTVSSSSTDEVRKPEPVKIDTSKLDKRLEKIAHPDQIKLFEKVTKIGNTLYGVRKGASTAITTEVKKAETADASAKNLEKIANPDQIKFYEKVTKIGNTLYGLKKKITTAIQNIKQDIKTTAAVLPTMTSDLITCASATIDAKDSKISEAITSSAADVATAISARGTCQKAALALSSEQHPAIAKCNQAFQAATKIANEKARNAQKEVWTTYNNSLKACSSAAKTTEIRIEDGGQNTTDTLAQ